MRNWYFLERSSERDGFAQHQRRFYSTPFFLSFLQKVETWQLRTKLDKNEHLTNRRSPANKKARSQTSLCSYKIAAIQMETAGKVQL